MSDAALQPLNIGLSLNNGILNQMSAQWNTGFQHVQLNTRRQENGSVQKLKDKNRSWKIKLGIFDSGK